MESGNNEVLDVTAYECPHPQILFVKAMKKLAGDDTLEVRIISSVSLEEIKNLCRKNGYEFAEKDDKEHYVLLVKKPIGGEKK